MTDLIFFAHTYCTKLNLRGFLPARVLVSTSSVEGLLSVENHEESVKVLNGIGSGLEFLMNLMLAE